MPHRVYRGIARCHSPSIEEDRHGREVEEATCDQPRVSRNRGEGADGQPEGEKAKEEVAREVVRDERPPADGPCARRAPYREEDGFSDPEAWAQLRAGDAPCSQRGRAETSFPSPLPLPDASPRTPRSSDLRSPGELGPWSGRHPPTARSPSRPRPCASRDRGPCRRVRSTPERSPHRLPRRRDDPPRGSNRQARPVVPAIARATTGPRAA
jgi:hypothetical protein